MIQGQEEGLNIASKLLDIATKIEADDSIKNGITAVKALMSQEGLYIPIVGEFSAGKTTMVNALLSRDKVLPVDIRPETALAMELHYGDDERLEGIKANGAIDRYDIADAKTLTSKAGDYMLARAYFNTPVLKDIEPLVIVDMPGFNSPNEAHNKAILVFIERGIHYIVLQSSDAGTISSSLLRQLESIYAFGKDFSFYISKAHLRSPADLNTVIAHTKEQLKDEFNEDYNVKALDNRDTAAVVSLVKELNADRLFRIAYRKTLLGQCDDLITAINIKISTIRRSTEELARGQKELELNIQRLSEKGNTDTTSMAQRYSGATVGEVIDDVGHALNSSIEELVSIASSGNNGALQDRINDIVRDALSISLNEKFSSVEQKIVGDFTLPMSDLNIVMKDLSISDNYLEDITNRVKSSMDLMGTIRNSFDTGNTTKLPTGLGNMGNLSKAGGVAAMAASVFATGVLNVALPVVGIVLTFLPTILQMLGGGGNQQQQAQDNVRNKIVGEVIPQIKRKLRQELPEKLSYQIQETISQVQSKFNEKLQADSATIKSQIEEKERDAKEQEAKLQGLEDGRKAIQNMRSTVDAWPQRGM